MAKYFTLHCLLGFSCLGKCVNTYNVLSAYLFYVYSIQILTVKMMRYMSVFMCVQSHVCAHVCAGRSTALGIGPEVLAISLNIKSLFGLEHTGSHRMAWQ